MAAEAEPESWQMPLQRLAIDLLLEIRTCSLALNIGHVLSVSLEVVACVRLQGIRIGFVVHHDGLLHQVFLLNWSCLSAPRKLFNNFKNAKRQKSCSHFKVQPADKGKHLSVCAGKTPLLYSYSLSISTADFSFDFSGIRTITKETKVPNSNP